MPRPVPLEVTLELFILHRWVVIGKPEAVSENEIIIRDATIVRTWGNSRGAGQLALQGPTNDTRLDPAGIVTVHPLCIVARIKCNEEKWANHNWETAV